MVEFVIEDNEGKFVPPTTKAWVRAEESLDAITDQWKSGEINYISLCKKVDGVLDKFPDILEAYQVKAMACLNLAQQSPEREKAVLLEMLQDVMDTCNAGLSVAKGKIPVGFKGSIEWAWLDNRSFLRLHHCLILIHIEKKEYLQAAKEITKHLKWNPSDNIGVRYIHGFVLYHAGEFDKSYKIMEKECTKKECLTYPPYLYTMALIDFQKERYAESATNLRLAFLDNTYIAETLMYGEQIPRQHNLSECLPFSRYEMVVEYAETGLLDEWLNDEKALGFARWVYNTPEATGDRLALAKYNNILTFRDLGSEDHSLIDRSYQDFERTVSGITVESTLPMIREVQTWRSCDESVWPWEWLRKKQK